MNLKHTNKLPLMMMILAFLSGALYVPAAAQDATCPGAPAPRLVIGRWANVTPGASNNLRDQPGKSGNILTQVSGGDSVLVLDGPTCADGFAWWKVSYNDQIGWMAEGSGSSYFTAPTTSPITEFTVDSQTNTVSVTFGGITFTYNGTVSKTVQADSVFAVQSDATNPMTQPAPEYVEFTFDDSHGSDTTQFIKANIGIYPVDAYSAVNDLAKQRLDTLKTLLAQKPATITAQEIPDLPPVNAGQVFHSNVKYLTFDKGTGIRFLTTYAQAVAAITNEQLLYQFVGLSDDGKTLISATFPVKSGQLADKFEDDKNFPDITSPQASQLFDAYVKQVISKLEAAPSSDFKPNLDDLDTLLQSIALVQSNKLK